MAQMTVPEYLKAIQQPPRGCEAVSLDTGLYCNLPRLQGQHTCAKHTPHES